MDTSHINQSPKVCVKHNEPIILFDQQQNKALCLTCVQEKTGMILIDQIQQKQQEMQFQSDKEFQQEQQQLQILLDSIQKYKQNIINGIDKIIQIIIDQIGNIKTTKEMFQNQLKQSNQFNVFEQLNIQLKQYKKNHEQVQTQIKQLFSDLQQKYMNIDFLSEKLTDSTQILEKIDNIDSKSKNIQIQVINQEMVQNSGVFQYELIEEQRIKERGFCRAFAFNKDNSILLIGIDSKINIFLFINGKIGQELQVLSNHKSDVNCLYLMKQSDYFVSGSLDKSIIIWKYESNNQWVSQSILTDHQNQVNCLLMNKEENLLISGSNDKTVKFWKKVNNQWSCQQTIDTGNWVFAMSLNEMENKLITCGTSAYVNVIEIQGNKQWSIKQKIEVDECGYRLCFTLGDQFVFQPQIKDQLEIYDYDSSSNLFKKQSQVQIQSCKECSKLFPCQFLRSLNILLVKHGQYLNIFKVSENKNYQLTQTIEYEHDWLYGTVSNDRQFLVTWDEGSGKIQVRKLKSMNE